MSPGTFVAGFHETWPIVHAEYAYGLARTGQTIVNVPDATVIRLYVDDEPLLLTTARMRRYERTLDMRAGTLSRELLWSTAAGKHVTVRSCRIVSLEHRHLAAIVYEVAVDEPAPVVLASLVLNRQDVQPAQRTPAVRSAAREAVRPARAPRAGRRVQRRPRASRVPDGEQRDDARRRRRARRRDGDAVRDPRVCHRRPHGVR